ncbi:hypothetical protein H112_08068 [Trichophyton rubrum D6]|uniref:Rhodopsin domain-containing protein n=1 Tax=Trichophyton rubrum CBS 288.86 TaxID=1215330 RepID=A0A022VQ17_TRIRU|nr:hypothetical protein H100_08096 [Trichophyton rubrum MR850]EZF37577.1 hypothetical protein H102_08052 [Trichophyton rubrum CBS 100081]EZF48145.1 hypothetical protein H103_08078 [Trichophyton rubrum CBS 288.86]EZF58867.1 hypothetical protein H104_08026 [Trichophyton rubrum CBS 289.86]EZF80147.1 hypothetical protein H110_08079 [Trichophyton rubrum MR1448]EZF90792.1 hypothetical protein H113_08141 [Trichophyton rubrum MR1459]EZG12328.1 hypothetical protein H107_08219 [Trichophyton rubrum CBS 
MLWTLIWVQFVVDVGTVIISFVQCRPINKFWDSSVPGHCWAPTVQQYVGFFQGSVCSAVDLVLAVFPASLLWNLNMEIKKVSLSLLMGLGIIAMIASITKTIQLQAITAKADITYAMAHLATWWTLEADSHQASYVHSKQLERSDDSKLLDRSCGSRNSIPNHGEVYLMEEGHRQDGYSSEGIDGMKKETTIGVTYETATRKDQRASMGAGFE